MKLDQEELLAMIYELIIKYSLPQAIMYSIYAYIFKARKDKVKLLSSPNPRSAGETRLQSSSNTYTSEIPRSQSDKVKTSISRREQ